MNLVSFNLFILLFTQVTSSQGKPWEGLLGIKTLKCSFVEEIVSQTSVDTFKGVIYFKSPDRLKMDTRDYAVYFLGEKSILYDKNIGKITQEAELSINLNWIFMIDSLFEYSLHADHYTLSPRQEISGLDSIHYIPAQRGFPKEFTLYGALSTFRFNFFDVYFDLEIPDSLFVIPQSGERDG